jgi:hypothetical protein
MRPLGFVLQATKDKKRYAKAMEDYTPPAGMETSVKAKGKKKKKDPNAPKRGQSSFMVFSNAIRSKVREDNPDATFGGIVSIFDEPGWCRVVSCQNKI